MRDRQTCVGCGKKSPETETNYTLISAQFGWRLTRFKNPDGSLVIEWRCPTCWREFKRARNMAPSDPNLVPGAPAGSGSRPAGRTPLPRPPTPFEAFRPRAPSVPGDTARRRSPPPPAPPITVPPAPPLASQKRPTVPPRPSSPPPRPSSPPRPTPASVPPTGRPGRPPR